MRTWLRLALSTILALGMMATLSIGAGVGSAGAQGKGATHGSTMRAVAQSACTAPVPGNSSVSNHGQCVSAAAHKNKNHKTTKKHHKTRASKTK